MKTNVDKVLSEAGYTKPIEVDETTLDYMRWLFEQAVWSLFKASAAGSAEAENELAWLIQQAKQRFGVSVTSILRNRLAWQKDWEHRFGDNHEN